MSGFLGGSAQNRDRAIAELNPLTKIRIFSFYQMKEQHEQFSKVKKVEVSNKNDIKMITVHEIVV